MRSALVALAALAGCAQPVDFSGSSAAPEPPGEITFYTAGPGDVMIVADRCAVRLCDAAAGADPDRFTTLSYLGMRSPTEAVFQRRDRAEVSVPVEATHAPGLFAPVRPEIAPAEAAFIPPRAADAPPTPDMTEIVVNPVAGVAFGTDEIEVVIASATPARVVYTVEPSP